MRLYYARKMMARNGIVRGLLSSRTPCVSTICLSRALTIIPTKKRKHLNFMTSANLPNGNRNQENMVEVAQALTTTTMVLDLLHEREVA
jgi:hypothetical protein